MNLWQSRFSIGSGLLCAALVSSCAGGGGAGGVQQTSYAPSMTGGGLASQVAPRDEGPRAWFLTAGANERGEAINALDFFPNNITIDVGDSITWTVGGNAHTVTFFAHLHVPRFPEGKPFGGSTYNGDVYTSSGFLAPGQTYTLTFTKAGSFPYECLFHSPVMMGTVTVQPRSAPYPWGQDFYTDEGRAAMASELADAQSAVSTFPYRDHGTTLAAGIAPGLSTGSPSHGTVLRFLDGDSLDPSTQTITIPVGTTLTWVNQSNNEPHTITFPRPGHTPPPSLGAFAPAQGGNVYDGSHLVHSGPLFPGQSVSLTFTARGTFTYYCLIHDFIGMIGTVVVQ